jgi:hypothetical protein
MTQQSIIKALPKEYTFTMSCTQIDSIVSSGQGIFVSGSTDFSMFIGGNIIKSNYTMPNFMQTLTGIMTFDDDTPIVELRKIPIEEARRIIHQYVKEHPGARTSDLIIELALEPDVVIQALSQLRREGKIERKDVGNK